MRHGKKINHLGRKSEHRKAMLSNMAASLIIHKRISTTVAKAKELRKYVEPLITKAKEDSTHSRRTVFSYLKHKEPVIELFSVVADKIADRPGGYTRILKTGNRIGDNADMCIIELVDFNDTYSVKKDDAKGKKKTTRRGRAGTKKTTDSVVEAEHTEAKPKKAPKTEKHVEETPVADVVEHEEIIDATPEDEPKE